MTAFTSTLTDTLLPHDGEGKAVLVLGTGAAVDFGVMGNFGSNLGSGLYLKFDLLSDFTGDGTLIGTGSSGQQFFKIGMNNGGTDRFTISLRDNTGLNLSGRITLATKDRQKRTIEIQITPSTNTIQVWVDGVAQTVTYTAQQTPATFVNFPRRITLGARDNGFGTLVEGSRAIVDNLLMGTSSGALYGSYDFNDASFPVADASGNSNNGSAVGTAQLVLGFLPMKKDVGKTPIDTVTFSEVLSRACTFARELLDSITNIDTLSKQTAWTLSDSITHNENFSVILIFSKVFNESISLIENLKKDTTRSISEVVTLVDTISYGIFYSRIVTDSITLVSSITKSVVKILKELPPIQYLVNSEGKYITVDGDYLVVDVGRGIRNTETLTKIVGYKRTVIDIVTVTDRIKILFNGLKNWYNKKYNKRNTTYQKKYVYEEDF